MSREIRCQDVVVGSGMQGFAAARACVAQGRDCIVLERGQGVGGVLRPVTLDEVSLDPGCHLWTSGGGPAGRREIEFLQDELGVEMVPVMGHCYVSISPDGVARMKLEGPSFEYLPEHIRQDAVQRAAAFDMASSDNEGLGTALPKAFGPDVSELLLSMARKLYVRDPSDLSMHAAVQMAISRVKLHTCEELDQEVTDHGDLGSLLCSHPLHQKADDVVKFYYPAHGLAFLLDQVENWLRDRVRDLLFGSTPRGIEAGGSGGVLVTQDCRIEYERLAWCCNPLELARLLGIEVPDKEATAGSASRSFFFRIRSGNPAVLYSHDFDTNSPMFRSWVPPAEMAPSDTGIRYAIVECPGVKETPVVIDDIRHRVAGIHGLDADGLEFLGSKAQVRFYPTGTYNRWLAATVAEINRSCPGIVMPGVPIHGKGGIAAWWGEALGGTS